MKTLFLSTICTALTVMNATAQIPTGRSDTLSPSSEGVAAMVRDYQQEQTRTDTTSKGKDLPPADDFMRFDVPPTVVSKVEPVYPEDAMTNNIEGKVWVKIWVDTEGKVRDVVLLKSDAEILNAPAIEAARHFVFTPAYNNKVPVAVWVSVPFKFKLASSKNSSAEEEKTTEKFLSMVREVIEQKDIVKAKAMLNPEAYMIDGAKFESIYEVLKSGRKGSALAAERTRKITFTQVRIEDNGKTAYMVLRTESQKLGNPRFHTILFSRDSAGTWRIEHWQISR